MGMSTVLGGGAGLNSRRYKRRRGIACVAIVSRSSVFLCSETKRKRLLRRLPQYLTIIPRARMGSESIAHEAERNNCFSKMQLVGQKYRE